MHRSQIPFLALPGSCQLFEQVIEFLLQALHIEVKRRSHIQGDNWETIGPPTRIKPSGRREAPSAPDPRAIGIAPIKAAKVVMMIGRKRSTLASCTASTGVFPVLIRALLSMGDFPIDANRGRLTKGEIKYACIFDSAWQTDMYAGS
jgi:hypothetical protein